VSDSFGLGDARPKLCVIAPKPPRSTTNPHPKKPKTVCRVQPIRPGVLSTRKKIQVKTKGTWIFELRGQGQRSRQTVAVGVKRKRPKTGLPVLLLGDSLMSQLITPIADRLEGKADVDALVRGGGRLTETEFDWYGQARTRLERLKPRVAVMLIGGGDGFPIKSGGQTIECCSEAWVTAYEPYVLKMMKVLSRNGRTAVAWGLQPAAESGAQREVQAAVNRAAELVYRQVPVTGLIDLNTVVSPGFQYQEYKTVGGRSYKIRASDGIHFTVFGAAIAGNFIADSIAPLLRH
jgi:hypothetical protein